MAFPKKFYKLYFETETRKINIILLPWQPHFQRVFRQTLAKNIGKTRFTLQMYFYRNLKSNFKIQHLKYDRCSDFQLNKTKTRTGTEDGGSLGLSMTKFEYDIIVTSHLVISSSIFIFMVDFTHVYSQNGQCLPLTSKPSETSKLRNESLN